MKELKNIVRIILKSPVLLVFALICVFILPRSINTMSIAFRSAIAVAVGINKNEQDKIVLQVAISVSSTTESLAENNKILSASGETVGEAFTNLNLMFGRFIKLGHTRFVMVGDKVSSENLAALLDRLIRTNKIRNTVQLIYCSSDIEEMFNVGVELKNSTGIKLSEIICHQQPDSTTSINSNIDSFFRGYLSPSGISKINAISLSKDYTNGIGTSVDGGAKTSDSSGEENSAESAPSEQSGQESSGGEQKQNSYISNKGQLAIYNSGKLEIVLSEQLSNGVNWLSKDYTQKNLLVKLDGLKNYGGATINFDVISKHLELETFFYKNIPFVSAKIVVSLAIDEIVLKDGPKVSLSNDIVDENVKSEIGREIRKQISLANSLAKSTKLDVFEFNNIFYKHNYWDYQNYLSTNSKQDVVENTQLSVDVDIEII